MSDFWWGVLAVPLVIATMAIGLAIAAGAVWFSIDVCKFNEWKLLPRQWGERATLAAVVAEAKWARYLWIPGWHIVICRTGLGGKESAERSRRHGYIRDTVRRAYQDLDTDRPEVDR
ncbi:hypothetical protein I5I01_gp76 [Mycobacterium phage MooMoo]|uniref:Uncharacterized protein n=1 Tax=Mycobacterium phage MooMoo TaxID=2108127 RepID=A0A2P1JRD4_9CAUD|nr:hypothetical protein I5I01_gp76 [Mycobacterium phage MooMoo]AVO21681.1 hypothetical protein SEA_MOOMOO_76 [Mycobacterium phage MooMoo]